MMTANSRIALILAGFLALGFVGDRASAETPDGFSQAELDQMLAPIALYPDTVLSHVLIAATYPLEVVQAARWSRANPGYAGEYAVEAVEHMPWDPSVMALAAFPELLARMDADLVWTQRLGDAFLIQEYQVLDTIQYLRDEAYAAGHLRSNEYVRVVRQPTHIYIEPAVTRVVYVPYYDPRVVYGAWRWSAYPPVYWDHPPRYRHRSGYSFYWSGGHHVQSAFFFSAFHWSSRRVVVHDHYRYGHRDRARHGHAGHGFSSGRDLARNTDAQHWRHDPAHRRGVAYRHGIDERHSVATSNRTAGYRDDRRDLLRHRSRAPDFTTQRPLARPTAPDPRSRQAAAPAATIRDGVLRDRNGRRDAAASDRRVLSASTSESSNPRPNQPDTRRAASDRTASRREPAQYHSSGGRSAPQANSRETGSNRTRGVQARSPAGRTSSRSTPRSSSRAIQHSASRSQPAAAARTAGVRSRPSSDSVGAGTRGNRRAISRESSRGTADRTRQSRTPPRSVRAETPTGKRSSGQTGRAALMGSRDRGRDGDRRR